MINAYLPFGEIVKPQGIDGIVKIAPESSETDFIMDLKSVFTKEGNEYKAHEICEAVFRDGYIYARIDNCKDRNQAELQRGWVLFIDRDHASPLKSGENYICDIIGSKVVDEKGNLIGKVLEISHPANRDIYTLKTAKGKMYFPSLPFVFITIDPETSLIVVDSQRLAEVSVFEN